MSFASRTVDFVKFQGAGNDFVMINLMTNNLILTEQQIGTLCNRRFGIGADGLITISRSEAAQFRMTYYNCDGRLASFCGNGGRCTAAFAYSLGIAGKTMTFEGFDGIHHAVIIEADGDDYAVELSMRDVSQFGFRNHDLIVDTGSPHYVTQVEDAGGIDIIAEGRRIRYDKSVSENGVNVDFVEKRKDRLFVRTYERGVEDETLACGTGVTASAMAASLWFGWNNVDIETPGGNLNVKFDKSGNSFTNVRLTGNAVASFRGNIKI